MLSYTPLGYSLPDLTISGFTAPTATWGGTLAVTVDVSNIGASTITEPLAQTPGSTSTADAVGASVGIFMTTRTRVTSRPGAIQQIGTIALPTIPQNSVEQFNQTITLPSQPAHYPGDGGTIHIFFVVNPTHSVLESDYTNNISGLSPVEIEAPLPQLEAVALDVPPVMQPGDTIQPNIEVANVGTANTSVQAPVTVALVASVDKTFGPGSSILATYTISNIPPISQVASQSQSLTSTNLNNPSNIVTINGAPVTLPTSPKTYYIGVVIDPTDQIKQIGKIGNVKASGHGFSLATHVGPPIKGLPPAGVIKAGGGVNNPLFPNPITTSAIGFPPPASSLTTTTPTPTTTPTTTGTPGSTATPAQFGRLPAEFAVQPKLPKG